LLHHGRAAIDRVVIVTDAAVNIFPTLEDKVHIVQNAIDLAHALGMTKPRGGNPLGDGDDQPEGAVDHRGRGLCKMAERGQITGGVLDGPLALDNAIDLGAAKIKKIDSPVAGQADILVVPDLEAGNMLAKSLSFMADADAAGIVLGARVPVILTSRADSVSTRLASCAVAASSPSGGARTCSERWWCDERGNCGSQRGLVQHQVLAVRGRDLELVVRGQAEAIHTAPRFAAKDPPVPRSRRRPGAKAPSSATTVRCSTSWRSCGSSSESFNSRASGTASCTAGSSTPNRCASTARCSKTWRSSFPLAPLHQPTT
jgi:hypothetical protein